MARCLSPSIRPEGPQLPRARCTPVRWAPQPPHLHTHLTHRPNTLRVRPVQLAHSAQLMARCLSHPHRPGGPLLPRARCSTVRRLPQFSRRHTDLTRRPNTLPVRPVQSAESVCTTGRRLGHQHRRRGPLVTPRSACTRCRLAQPPTQLTHTDRPLQTNATRRHCSGTVRVIPQRSSESLVMVRAHPVVDELRRAALPSQLSTPSRTSRVGPLGRPRDAWIVRKTRKTAGACRLHQTDAARVVAKPLWRSRIDLVPAPLVPVQRHPAVSRQATSTYSARGRSRSCDAKASLRVQDSSSPARCSPRVRQSAQAQRCPAALRLSQLHAAPHRAAAHRVHSDPWPPCTGDARAVTA
jgi:hypothetical protein